MQEGFLVIIQTRNYLLKLINPWMIKENSSEFSYVLTSTHNWWVDPSNILSHSASLSACSIINSIITFTAPT